MKIWVFRASNGNIVQVEEIGEGRVIMHTSPTKRIRTTWQYVDSLKMEYITTIRSLKPISSFNGEEWHD